MTQNIEISVITPKLRLEQVLKEAGIEDATTVSRLTVRGTIAEDDLRYIRIKMGKTLNELNLSDVEIERENNPKRDFEKDDIFELAEHIVTSCAKFVFSDCTGLTFISLPNWMTFIDTAAFARCTELTSIVFPQSILEIAEWAFFGCVGLTSVTIPNTLKLIGHRAFYGCNGLTSVTIPNSVTEIVESAFEDCPAYFTVHPDNPIYTSEDGKLKKKRNPQNRKHRRFSKK